MCKRIRGHSLIRDRVGGFGFLAGKELAAERSTNLGLRDQRLGLKWAQVHLDQSADKLTISLIDYRRILLPLVVTLPRSPSGESLQEQSLSPITPSSKEETLITMEANCFELPL